MKILTVELRHEHDVVLARQRAREIAALLGFDAHEQVRIGTAVSEIARNAYRYAGSGKVDFSIEDRIPPLFQIAVRDTGPGIADLNSILDGRYKSTTGMGLGIIGAKRLMDSFHIESEPGKGTRVLLGKELRQNSPLVADAATKIAEELARRKPEDPFQEIQRQNQELLRTLDELRQRQSELAHLNRELEDTNRGVVALYAELDERADYLRRASELKTRFLSNMTHEFRTPLNSILSLSRLLLDRLDGDLTPEQEKQVTYIRKSAEDLSELVNDLLDLAKVEAGKIIVRPQTFTAQDLFGALRGMLRPLLAHNTAVNLVFDEPQDVPVLNTDEGKVSQILRNFISNALKFTEKGEVRVSATMRDPDTVVFSVADTGFGIAPEDQERIFVEFTQLDNPVQKKVRGTGLGLPLSRKLAELLGGTITVDSELGLGSTFHLVLPLAYKGPAEVTFAPDVTRKIDPTRRPVLVVEDNKETLFVYEKYLRNTGYQVLPAHNLSEARQVLREVRPVAVILDILLQGENSWIFLSELKGAEQTRSVPVIVATVVDNKNKAKALGADDFAVKPVDRNWLLERLDEYTQPMSAERALVIDDDEISRYLLSGLLADTRYEVIEAAGGQEGLRLASERKPGVIFLDLVMPDMDGFQVLDRLKSEEQTREIPVIIYSSKKLTDPERSRLQARCVAVLPKESPSREVASARIREALTLAGLSREAPEKGTEHA